VICTLNSVCFVDARCGWAAGGTVFPFSHDTAGVVLVTRDGGITWQREPVLLPAVRKIRFLSQRQGYAIACPSAMFPGGAFLSRDAGRSWQPACSGGAARLSTGDFFDGQNAILGGSLGLMAAINGGDFSRGIPSPGNPGEGQGVRALQSVHEMRVVPPGYGWLVGDGGWVALTGNRGKSWMPPLGTLPPGAALFDFCTLAVRGPKCWIAGSPGSRVFFTPDAGRNWSAFPTGTSIPACAITFVDDMHGWTVGQLGQILASDDGGRSWRQQRSGGARAAVMALAGVPQDLPLELLAQCCKEQGHLGVAEVLGRCDVPGELQGDAPAADRLHQAMLEVGVSAGEIAWEFPVQHPDLRLSAQANADGWNRVHNGHGTEALLARIVRQIRIWRPSVVLIAASEDGGGLREIVQQSASLAIQRAGDPTYLPELFCASFAGTELVKTSGCPPWKVQRAYLVTSRQGSGKVVLADKDWSSSLGETWADAVLPARALLANGDPVPMSVACVQPLTQSSANEAIAPAVARPHIGDAQNRFDFMADVSATDGLSRRTGSKNQFGNSLDGLAHSRRLDAVFEEVETDPEAVFARLSHGDELPSGITASAAAVMTYRIADRFRNTGRWDLYDKTLALLAERYAGDPLARWALLRRFQSLAASENSGLPADQGRAALRFVSQSAPAEDVPPKSRGEQALALARMIEINQPDLFASPAIRYPLAAVYRQLRRDGEAQRLYALDRRGVDRDAWWNCARGEMWLLDRKGPPPKPLVNCVVAKNRPHLDGRLNDELWQQCKPVLLSSPAGGDSAWPATVRLAHDDQYLYIAIQCRQAAGAHYEATDEKRQRDADLSQRDRVDIFLDLDRDYATYYQLTIDHRGWAAEARCGDRSWHPKWFIAAQSTGGEWTAEAAIPLAELNAAILPGKTIWAIGIQRTVPGVGFQSWTTPAAVEVVPEGFGWLGFE
jgi:photosystem II stability/assembly factor-like uncharacterized protein